MNSSTPHRQTSLEIDKPQMRNEKGHFFNPDKPPHRLTEEDKLERVKHLEIELRRLEGELFKRHRENGISYYVPNKKQYLAHRSPCKEIYYAGGNRSGKTTFSMAEVVIHTTGTYPSWYPLERRLNRPVKVKIISPKFKEGINDTIEPKLRSLMPKNMILGTPKRSPQGYIVHMDVKWRGKEGFISTIDFLTQEQDMMSFEGTDADIVVCDEPLKRGIYVALMRSLVDRDGWFICAYTALKESWIKEVTDKADGKLRDFFVADIRDNKFDIQGNPILKEESIQRFEDMLTEDEKEVRLHGKYYHLSGLVYKEFDPAVHIIDKLPEKFITWASLDPHDRNPHWMIWAAVDPTGDVVVYKELIRNCPLYDLTQDIKSIEKDISMHSRILDPNYGHKPSAVGSNITVQDQLRKYGVDFIDAATDDEDAGIAVVREYLRYNKNKPVEFTNRPKLYFLRNAVPQTIRAFSNLQYKDWRSGQDDKEENERIMEKNKHAADTIRYLLVSRPRYQRFRRFEGLDEPIY